MAIRDIDPSQGIIIAATAYRTAGEVPRPKELMDIPLLIDFSIFQLRNLLEKIEVDRAIKGLTSSELLQLQLFAKFRTSASKSCQLRPSFQTLHPIILKTDLG
ncbi:MAG: hypothetical protein WA741_12600 [Candidatus Sulfotelmatobacter sp.]